MTNELMVILIKRLFLLTVLALFSANSHASSDLANEVLDFSFIGTKMFMCGDQSNDQNGLYFFNFGSGKGHWVHRITDRYFYLPAKLVTLSEGSMYFEVTWLEGKRVEKIRIGRNTLSYNHLAEIEISSGEIIQKDVSSGECVIGNGAATIDELTKWLETKKKF